MKMFLGLIVLSLVSLTSHAQQQCAGAKMGKNATDLIWNHPEAVGKMVVVKNLDTNLVYPKDVAYKTSGKISLQDLLPNKKGYSLLLVDLTTESLAEVKSSTQDCVKKGDCSMKESQLKVKNTPCSWLEFNVK